MWQTILDLFTYPGKTIDRLLAEQNYVKSNRIFFLTMVMVSLSSVFSCYLQQYSTADIGPWLITLAAIGPIGGLLFARFLFRNLVQLGLLMVAGRTSLGEPAERRERARQLYLLYPYHVVALTVPSAILPFAVAPVGNDSIHLFARLVLMIGYVLLSLATVVFQIVVMVMIVRRVYNVTITQAFWGPMLAYFLFGILLGIIMLSIVLIFYIMARLIT